MPRTKAKAKGTPRTHTTGPLVSRSTFDPEHRIVAITGACSFQGTELIKQIDKETHIAKIIAIDYQRPALPPGKTDFFKVDLTLPAADVEVSHLLKREKVDTLVHLAFLANPTHNVSWAHELEVIGTLHMLNACAACKVHKVIFWSQTSLYGPQSSNPNFLTETHKLSGIVDSSFFNDKIEAERLARRFRKENSGSIVTILRMAPLFGRNIHNYITHYFSLPLVPTLMGYDPLVQLLHETDAVAALKRAIDLDFDGEYNIAGEGVLPLSTMLALAKKITIPFPYSVAYTVSKMLWLTQLIKISPDFLDFLRYLCIADLERMKGEMGFMPRYNIRQILADFIQATADEDKTNRFSEHSSLLDSRGKHV